MSSNALIHNVFLSYNHDSKDIVKKINENLKKEFFNTWIDSEKIKAGDPLNEKIAEGILNSNIVLCFITKKYCESKNCVAELTLAEEQKIPVIPIILEDLKKDEHKKNAKIHGVRMTLIDKLQFYAFKPPETFDPWSDELFKNLVQEIKKIILSLETKEKKIFKHIEHISPNISGSIRSLGLINENFFAFGTRDGFIEVWSTHEFKFVKKIQHTELDHKDNYCGDWVHALIMLNSEMFASCGGYGSIKIWSSQDFTCIKHIQAYKEDCHPWILDLVLLNVNYFASGSRLGFIKIWSIQDYSCVYNIKHDDDMVMSLLKLNSHAFASGSSGGSIKIWSTNNFKCIKHIETDYSRTNGYSFRIIMLSNDLFASGECYGKINIWSISRDYTCVAHIKHAGEIWGLLKLNDDMFVSSSGQIWSTHDFTCIKQIPNVEIYNGSGDLCLLNKDMFAIASFNNSIDIWSIGDYEYLTKN